MEIPELDPADLEPLRNDIGLLVLDKDGIECVHPLIRGEDDVPCTIEHTLGFPFDGMTAMRATLTDGAAVLGELVLVGLPVHAKGDVVVLEITHTGTSLTATLTDPTSQRVARLSREL